METWERFTGHARRAILLAHGEAAKAKSADIGTEHLLLGLLRLGEGLARDVLQYLGVDLGELEHELRVGLPAGAVETPGTDIAFTADARASLEYAWNEAKATGHSHVGTEHILVGLVRLGRGAAHGTLERHGVTPGKAQESLAACRERRAAVPDEQPKERLRRVLGLPDPEKLEAVDVDVTIPLLRAQVSHLQARLDRLGRVADAREAETQRQAELARHLRLARVYLYVLLVGIGFCGIASLVISATHETLMTAVAERLYVPVYELSLAALWFLAAAKFASLALGMAALYHCLNAWALRRR